VYINPASVAKTLKLPYRLDGVELLLPNRVEAEVLAGMKIDFIEDCGIACEEFRERGVK